jgi:hypothetical protein
MISYVLSSFQADRITVIYNMGLDKVGFRQYLINNFRDKSFSFVRIDFQTRGPAETLLIGLKSLYGTGQLLVLDNDNIYNGLVLSDVPKGNFVLYTDNPTGLAHYSFVELAGNGRISQIAERSAISDHVCMGGYGFESIEMCRDFCKELIMEETSEPYLSQVFQKMLDSGLTVQGHYLPNVFSIGTEKDILLNTAKLAKRKLRIVFDLDNTLVTWPNVFKDYSTVDRIDHMAKFASHVRQRGHEVIIYTARNSVTCGHNTGQVLKNVGLTTLQSLKQLGIDYDEIHFGKPFGDLYIDDRCFNTYDDGLFAKMGFYEFVPKAGAGEFKTNRYNSVVRINRTMIQKTGPNLAGEIFVYRTVADTSIAGLFPKFIQQESDFSFRMEFINGTQLRKIYYEGLLQEKALRHLLDTARRIHLEPIDDGVIITAEDIHCHYINKFEDRSRQVHDFPFDDFSDVYAQIKSNLEKFLQLKYPVDNIIHGDLWFSNIMMFQKEFKMFDMRGKFNNKLTVKGHRLYDWAKLYQSIQGLDAIIDYGSVVDGDTKARAVHVFWDHLISNGFIQPADRKIIVQLAAYLVYGTLTFYDNEFSLKRRNMVWELVKECLREANCIDGQ